MLYNIVVVSAIHGHESAMGGHVSPLLTAPPPRPTSLPSEWRSCHHCLVSWYLTEKSLLSYVSTANMLFDTFTTLGVRMIMTSVSCWFGICSWFMLAINAWSSHDELLRGGSYHCSLIAPPHLLSPSSWATCHQRPGCRCPLSVKFDLRKFAGVSGRTEKLPPCFCGIPYMWWTYADWLSLFFSPCFSWCWWQLVIPIQIMITNSLHSVLKYGQLLIINMLSNVLFTHLLRLLLWGLAHFCYIITTHVFKLFKMSRPNITQWFI